MEFYEDRPYYQFQAPGKTQRGFSDRILDRLGPLEVRRESSRFEKSWLRGASRLAAPGAAARATDDELRTASN
jgi:hypothetical protein